eukprot:COSAG02_NODE_11970_length_1622_cov_3.242285_2_plen_64_part_01
MLIAFRLDVDEMAVPSPEVMKLSVFSSLASSVYYITSITFTNTHYLFNFTHTSNRIRRAPPRPR